MTWGVIVYKLDFNFKGGVLGNYYSIVMADDSAYNAMTESISSSSIQKIIFGKKEIPEKGVDKKLDGVCKLVAKLNSGKETEVKIKKELSSIFY
jgi:hypothetical protein